MSTGGISAGRLTLVSIATLMVGVSSCRIPFDFCVGAPNLTIYPVDDSVHVGQTVGLQAYYTQGFWPACASTWTSGNPKVLSVKASSTANTTATGVAPGIAVVKLVIGNDEAVDTVTVVP